MAFLRSRSNRRVRIKCDDDGENDDRKTKRGRKGEEECGRKGQRRRKRHMLPGFVINPFCVLTF